MSAMTEYWNEVDRLKELKRSGQLGEAEELLLECVHQTEQESQESVKLFGAPVGVAPWYYEQLAILYAKQQRFADEVSILERYAQQPEAPGAGQAKLRARLEKAKSG